MRTQILQSLRLSALIAAVMFGATAFAADYRVYVTNEISGDLSIIDGETLSVIATVPLGKRPRGIEPSPDGSQLYVALSGSPPSPPWIDESKLPPPDKSADGIGLYSIAEGKLIAVIKGVSDPEQVAVGPREQRLLIASEDTGTAVIVNAATRDIVRSVPVGIEPEGVAISPDGRYGYVTSEGKGTVAIIDMASGKVIKHLEVGMRPRGIVFSRDGTRAYATSEIGGTLSAIDTATMEIVTTVEVPGEGARPMTVVVSPDGDSIYVTTGRGGTLVAFDAEPLTYRSSVQVGERPWGLALSPDGRYAFTANGPSNDVSVVDTRLMKVIETIPVGTGPWGVAVAGAPPAAASP